MYCISVWFCHLVTPCCSDHFLPIRRTFNLSAHLRYLVNELCSLRHLLVVQVELNKSLNVRVQISSGYGFRSKWLWTAKQRLPSALIDCWCWSDRPHPLDSALYAIGITEIFNCGHIRGLKARCCSWLLLILLCNNKTILDYSIVKNSKCHFHLLA